MEEGKFLLPSPLLVNQNLQLQMGTPLRHKRTKEKMP
jgi:hypothetical protein